MKHFIYTWHVFTPRNGFPRYTVRLYQIVRNTPRFIGVLSDNFVSEFQLVMQALEAYKALPKRAFELSQFGGHKYCEAYLLREAGIADVRRVV